MNNKTILELGSGIGLTGLIVNKDCNPKKIYLTDCHDAVLDRLRENVKLNVNANKFNVNSNFYENSSKTKHSKESQIEILNLPWEKVTEEVAENLAPDILLAADVVYDPDLFESLATAIQYFLLNKKTCKAILACTERNQETLNKFLLVIGKQTFIHLVLRFVREISF